MSRLVFVNRYYAPDQSATAQLLTDLAGHLERSGQSVHIVTSRLLYDDATARLPARDELDGVTVWRVWTSRFGRANLFGRAFDYLTFYLSAMWRLLWLVRRGDTVIAKTDPPLISIVAAVVCWIKGARLINWLQDLFPEVAEALGVGLAKGPLGRLLRRLRNWSLKRAETNVVLGELMKERLLANGIPEHRIAVIHNWVVGELEPVARADNPLVREWGLGGKFVVGYSGNLGRAHNYQAMLGAIEKLQHRSDLVFLFIGGGAGMDVLKHEVGARGLQNVLFKPYQPLERLSQSLSVADIHLITLEPALEGLIVPSKFYGVMAVGRPICYIGDRNGEIARLIDRYRLGAVTEGSSELVFAIVEMAQNANERISALPDSHNELFSAERAYVLWWGVIALQESGLAWSE
jgi:glycosyltransferase involved in cell wall biosynthesis